MESKVLEDLIRGLIERADRLNLLYLSGAGVALVVATLKFQGDKKEFEFKGVSFKLRQYWIVAIAFTLVHIYFSFLLVNACHKFTLLDTPSKKTALIKLTYSDAPFIFQDMSLVTPTGTKYQYSLDFKSPAAVLLVGILLLMVITIIKVEKKTFRQRFFYFFMAYIILVTNYFTGGWWMIELSKSLTTS